MLIWGRYMSVLIAANIYLMKVSCGLLVACVRVYEKMGVIALQLPSPRTRDLTLEKHPLVKKRPLAALRKSALPQPTRYLQKHANS